MFHLEAWEGKERNKKTQEKKPKNQRVTKNRTKIRVVSGSISAHYL